MSALDKAFMRLWVSRCIAALEQLPPLPERSARIELLRQSLAEYESNVIVFRRAA